MYRSPNTRPPSSEAVEAVAITLSYLLVAITFPFSLFACFKVVREYERAVIFRMGRLRKGGARGPGTFFVLPCVDEYNAIDLRTLQLDVPPQVTTAAMPTQHPPNAIFKDVLTKDSVTVTIDAVAFFRIFNPLLAIVSVSDYRDSTATKALTTLRDVVGTVTLSELVEDREKVAERLQKILDEETDPWGIKVERVELTDIQLPFDLRKTMAAEAEANRTAKAKFIAADGELKASKALKEAADVMALSVGALNLRYLQTLREITGDNKTYIVYPLPIDMAAAFY